MSDIPLFKVGDEVKLKKLFTYTYGLGEAKPEDIGIIKDIQIVNNVLILFIPRINVLYRFALNEVEHVKTLQARDILKEDTQQALLADILNIDKSLLACFKTENITLVKHINEVESRISTYTKERIRLEAYIRSLTAQLSNPNNKETVRNKAVDLILNDVGYQDIKFVSGAIVALTKPITIKYKGFNISMGEYKVTLDSYNKTLCVDSINHKLESRFDHPHIENGKPCWGTYSTNVITALSNYDWIAILNLVAEFVNSCDENGWYRDVRYWLPDAKDRCHTCWEIQESCTCPDEETCADCGELFDDCTCLICPTSNDRLEDNSFPDSYCFRCGHCVHDIPNNLWRCIEADYEEEYFSRQRQETDRYRTIEDIPDDEPTPPPLPSTVRVTDEIATEENYLPARVHPHSDLPILFSDPFEEDYSEQPVPQEVSHES